MPDWLVKILLLIFIIHFVIFARVALKKNERYYWLISTTFLLLTISFSCRLWFESIQLFGMPAYWVPRITAWFCTALAIYFAIRRRKKAKLAADH